MRRSQASASEKPAPAAGPGSAASVGFSSRWSAAEDPVLEAQQALALLGRGRLAVARHQLGVAARAEGAARAGQEHAADAGVRAERGEQRRERLLHLEGERVPRLGAVERHDGDARPRCGSGAARCPSRRRAPGAGHGTLRAAQAITSAGPSVSEERSMGLPEPPAAGREPAAAGQLRRPDRVRDRRRHGPRQGDRASSSRASARASRSSRAARSTAPRASRRSRPLGARRSASPATCARPSRWPRPSTRSRPSSASRACS